MDPVDLLLRSVLSVLYLLRVSLWVHTCTYVLCVSLYVPTCTVKPL